MQPTSDPDNVATSVLAQDDAAKLKNLFSRAKNIIGDDDRLGDIWNDIDLILSKYDGPKDNKTMDPIATVSATTQTTTELETKIDDEMEQKLREALISSMEHQFKHVQQDLDDKTKSEIDLFFDLFKLIETMAKTSDKWKDVNDTLNNINGFIPKMLGIYHKWKELTSSRELSKGRVYFISKFAKLLDGLFQPMGSQLKKMFKKWAKEWLKLNDTKAGDEMETNDNYFDLVEYSLKLCEAFASQQPNATGDYTWANIDMAHTMYYFHRNVVLFESTESEKKESDQFNLWAQEKFDPLQVNRAWVCTYVSTLKHLPVLKKDTFVKRKTVTVELELKKDDKLGVDISKTTEDLNSLGFYIGLGVDIDATDGYVTYTDYNTALKSTSTMTTFFLNAEELESDDNQNFGMTMFVTADNDITLYCGVEGDSDNNDKSESIDEDDKDSDKYALYCKYRSVLTNQKFVMFFDGDQSSTFKIQSQITGKFLRHNSDGKFFASAEKDDSDVDEFQFV